MIACSETSDCDKTGSLDGKCLMDHPTVCACREGYFGDKCEKERGQYLKNKNNRQFNYNMCCIDIIIITDCYVCHNSQYFNYLHFIHIIKIINVVTATCTADNFKVTVKPYGKQGGNSKEGVVYFANNQDEFEALRKVGCKDTDKEQDGIFESPTINKKDGYDKTCKPPGVSIRIMRKTRQYIQELLVMPIMDLKNSVLNYY